MSHRKVTVAVKRPQDDADFLRCMDFVMHTEWERKTKTSFAEKWKISPNQLFRLQLAWGNSGLIADCREIISLALYQDVETAQRQTLRQTAAIMESWVNLALYATREDVRATAIRDIYTLVIKPAQDGQSSTGNEEADYMALITNHDRLLDPMSVVGPPRVGQGEEESTEDEDLATEDASLETELPQTPFE